MTAISTPNFDRRIFTMTDAQLARLGRIASTVGGTVTDPSESDSIITTHATDKAREIEYIAAINADGALISLDMRFTNKGMRDIREDGQFPILERMASFHSIKGTEMWDRLTA